MPSASRGNVANVAFPLATSLGCDIELGKLMKTYTGREMAAKMRDGEFDTVELIASLNTYNARDEKQGEAIGTRVHLPEATLGGRLDNMKFSIEREYERENKVVVRLRV